MDQNTTGGTDKRNWRERLGIGAKEVAPKEMPRIAEEFKPAPAAPRSSGPTVANGVKPAPMAPRIVAKPAAPAPILRPAAIAPDALANKLKSQRDAAEKLAEQRVLAARQRAEAAMVSPSAVPKPSPSAVPKPKFTFADDESKSIKPGAPLRPAIPPSTARPGSALPPALPQAPSNFVPQIAPPRPPLGGAAPVPQPRVPQPQQAYPQGQPYSQQPYVPQQPQQGYAPPPAYRPVDPATGYAPPPAYNPPPGYNPPPRQNFGVPVGQPQPRLQVPPRGQGEDFAPTNYDPQPRPNPRLAPVRTSQQQSYNEAEDDIFEKPAARRATANDYQQAYREVESGYEDEPSRSNVPWILAGLLLLVLAGFGSIWAYTNYVKPQLSAKSGQTVPLIAAPAQATKVTPDATTAAPAVAPSQAAQPTKKQIYDRIVGDREVLGGQIVPTEQTPVQPATNSQAVPAPADAAPAPAAGTGTDGIPLPLPPPPGATGDGTQGSLDPAGKSDQKIANITPAAGASPAANLPLEVPAVPAQVVDVADKAKTIVDAPQVSATAAVQAVTPTSVAPATEQASETIQDTPAVEQKPVVAEAPKKAKLVEHKKPEADAIAQKSLGSKPVVLVPPSNKLAASQDEVVISDSTPNTAGGLYGNATAGQTAIASQDTNVVIAAPVKKHRTLLDLFKKSDTSADTSAVAGDNTLMQPVQPDLTPAVKPAQKIAAATPPAAETVVSPTGAFVAQLASFKSKAEATQEYNRMRSKHGEIVGRYAPIVSEAQVAGTTRYRLSIGPMASANVASSLCQSLFAAGERDCLVHRQ